MSAPDLPDGGTVPPDHPVRARDEALAIPPAWTEVWVCVAEQGHAQATERDEAGRKQYLYHPPPPTARTA